MLPGITPQGSPSTALQGLTRRHVVQAGILIGVSLLGWLALAWLALDMGTPWAQLAMPMSSRWSPSNVAAVGVMWAVMMVAMMLPSALPMILTFGAVARRGGHRDRVWIFAAAYVTVWVMLSAFGTAVQWALHGLGAVDMMGRGSARVGAVLLLVAGLYQFSPLKRLCLSRCRTPIGFLLGEWRDGPRGVFVMGLRHGLFCAGCCWALMALLFVGGMMNLAWVAALAVAVAMEKMLPRGEWLAKALGAVLIVAGVVTWAAPM